MTIQFYKCVQNSRHVSLYSNGVIHLSARAIRDFDIANWEQIVLGYDSESEEIVIKKCEKNDFGGLNLKHHYHPLNKNQVGPASISAKRFFDHFDLQISNVCGRRYECYKKGNLVAFSLTGEKQEKLNEKRESKWLF